MVYDASLIHPTLACQKIRVCQRCDEIEYEDEYDIEHNWGDWEVDPYDPCQLVRYCQRCPKEEHRKNHLWNEDKICERCGNKKKWYN